MQPAARDSPQRRWAIALRGDDRAGRDAVAEAGSPRGRRVRVIRPPSTRGEGGENIRPETGGELPVAGPGGSGAELTSCDVDAVQQRNMAPRHGAALRNELGSAVEDVRSRLRGWRCPWGNLGKIGGLYEPAAGQIQVACWACCAGLCSRFSAGLLFQLRLLCLDHRGARAAPMALAGGAITLWAQGRR